MTYRNLTPDGRAALDYIFGQQLSLRNICEERPLPPGFWEDVGAKRPKGDKYKPVKPGWYVTRYADGRHTLAHFLDGGDKMCRDMWMPRNPSPAPVTARRCERCEAALRAKESAREGE